MSRPSLRHRRLVLALLLLAAAIAPAACSTGASVPASSGPLTAGVPPSVAASGALASGGTSTGGDSALDPCTRLTKADVQPFFDIPVVTELPGPTPLGLLCEFAANDAPGGVSTSLDIDIQTGPDATLRWQVATTGGGQTMFSGVGDQAEHLPGAPDFLAIKGDVVCGITTVGWTHLAGKAAYQPGSIPDAVATQIAQSYGTLCNKIFGSGNTTPTVTAGPMVDLGTSAPPAASVAVPAQGGTLNGVFPLPVGIDCTGVTTTDSEGTIVCSATNTADQADVYPFYLAALPGHGYTINSEREEMALGKEVAFIGFDGNGAGGFSSISIIGTAVTITLQAP